MAQIFNIKMIRDIKPYRQELVRFWQKFMVSDYTDSRIDWLYGKNPDGPTTTWLAFPEGRDEIAGCGSIYPRTFNFRGKPVRTAIAVDFAVDQKYRVFGPALAIQKSILSHLKDSGYELAFVYPNKESSKLFQRAGYNYIGKAQGWLLVIDAAYVVSKFTRSSVAKSIIPNILNKLIFAHHYLLLKRNHFNYIGEISNDCPDNVNALWDKEKENYNAIPNKSSSYLNWYHTENTHYEYKYYFVYDKHNHNLKGYVIFSIQDNYIEITDIFPSTEKHLSILLWHFIKEMRKQKATALRIAFYGDERFQRLIRRFGFIQRDSSRDYLICPLTTSGESYMSDIVNMQSVYLFFS